MTKQQVIKKLAAMQIADAVEFTYCNVLKRYEVKVYLGNWVMKGSARRREYIPELAEMLYCKAIEKQY